MTTATEGQRPSSGCSCIGHRAGFARRRARGSGHAAHETATCSLAGVKPGPETPAVDVSRSRGRTKGRLGRWIRNGWVLRAGACETLRGLRSVFCSQSARRRLRTGRAHVLAWGAPRRARFALNAQGDVMAARVVGVRQEGIETLPDGAVQEGRGTRTAAMTSRARCKVRDCKLPRWCAGCELPRWYCAIKKIYI